jgi:RND family efflux transporter MFP subunit
MNIRRNRNVGIGVVLVAAVAAVVFWPTGEEQTTDTQESVPVVQVTTAGEFTGQTTVSLIGTVRAFSEAAITAEQPGRVTSVPVRLGQSVQAGQVIATQENASQQAAVLQAEGVYDASVAARDNALVSDSQSVIGVQEALLVKTNAQKNTVSSLKSAYNTANGVVLNSIDPFFSSPDAQVPGLKLDGKGNTQALNSLRVEFQSVLPQWQVRLNSVNANSDLESEIQYAEQSLQKTVNFVETFIQILAQQENSSRYTDAELISFGTSFNTLRSNLNTSQSALDAARSSLNSADEALDRAQLTTTVTSTSASDAQIKQALGSLRAAQANLAKTVLRSPISGTVNNLSVRQGDFIGAQQQVALVANNNALEIVTAIGEQERDAFAIGDTVTIEDDLDGSVTAIAPAVSAGTGKIEVRIAAESIDLKNGDTVTITRQATTSVDSRVFVPLSAVKFEQTDGDMFVVTDGMLVARPVTLGIVRGGAVEILTGMTSTEQFVTDARGLQAGTAVEVTN